MDFGLTPEQTTLVESVSKLAEREFGARAFQRDGFAWDSLKVLADHDLTGLTLPVEVGGQGASLLDAVLVMMAITKVCPHSADALQASNFGAIRQVAKFGSEHVRREVLPLLLRGEALVTAGMSEPDAGSALTDLRTTARYEGDHVVLDGQKCWNSHGPDATHSVVWCRFGPSSRDIGAVLVPFDAPGFTRGKRELHMSGESHCQLFFDGCRVPKEYVLADSGALRSMLSIFGVERMGNASRALALAETAYERAVEHAKVRKAFGKDLCEFQGLQWKFADMRVELDAARMLLLRAVANADAGAPDATEAAIAKLHANRTAFQVANEAMQVFGASGYSQEYPLEYIVRRTRGWMIAGGSVEILKNTIAGSVFGRRFDQRAGAGA
ncbi:MULTISPECIES: acyl-CoA dehydrogenase family protein [unclassified Pseudonocardia]|jgi:alkylation response protein AidB-like acyl-CoA dehydrogenase|uniref:acyl-CoA dehydrogenase family protein n=1 Tax=unclassified Pseudonocardia TaxID=2619320 RepID=UPI0001FFE95A|nr:MULTISPECIES: acyl-CoA dehydrogenase family protein [unclassified Pseudonocardia]ALL76721.1 acyl-CoA dehydrogenase [Pseudonocardia sp. EC080610-09]ALL83749.1 acyl-CoA dehydrogenase [Pseudonocardia sp. EC080619-01]OLM18885.1 Butyryl-CoA dehydrogenase [Pseudonocardia sp. Ae707_Ps1]